LLLAVGVAAVLLLRESNEYTVTAQFQSAAQIVKGNLVKISGRSVGEVQEIKLTPDGQAALKLKIDDEAAPLREGTEAHIRMASLSGVANRYVDLHLPEGKPDAIDDGGQISSDRTTVQVDFDQLFALFDKRTRKGLTNYIRGSATQYAGRGREANLGWRYLNPSLIASQRLFRELTYDQPALERFLVESSKLVTDIADRRDDLAKLIDQLADMTGALAAERGSLARAIAALPPFMRRANSTYVNLRGTLDDFAPLVEESKPVAPLLRTYLAELRPFARDARPTIRDLSRLVRNRGKDNDLIELGRSILPFRDIAIGPVQANGKERPGSFQTSTESLKGQTPHFAYQRPYFVDFTGWLDDFSHSGIYDANGSASRVATTVNAFAAVGPVLAPVPNPLRDEVFEAVATTSRQTNRCPGAIERRIDGSNPWKPSEDYNCDESEQAVGR